MSEQIDRAAAAPPDTARQVRPAGGGKSTRHPYIRSRNRALITGQLRADPGRSDRAIGAQVGVDGKTVARVREELEAAGVILALAVTRGRDGKVRRARRQAPSPAVGAVPESQETG